MRFLFFLLITFKVNAFEVFHLQSGKIISENVFLDSLPTEANFLLGEYHYNKKIQKTQANLIKKIIKTKNLESNFSVGWEFLDYNNQAIIESNFSKYKHGKISNKKLLKEILKNYLPIKDNTYLPILKATKELDGDLLGLNASRELKSIITLGGLASMSAKDIPPLMKLGSKNYFERFSHAMGGHIPPHKLQNYFEAQCFTDSVMAYYSQLFSKHNTRFSIVGSFHTDYFLGLSHQITRYSNLETIVIKIINKNDHSLEEIELFKKYDSIYGFIADYLIII